MYKCHLRKEVTNKKNMTNIRSGPRVSVSLSPVCPSVQVGNHIDILSKKWVAQDAGIGAGVDSYFEYLVKGAIMLQDEELLDMFLGNAHTALTQPLILTTDTD